MNERKDVSVDLTLLECERVCGAPMPQSLPSGPEHRHLARVGLVICAATFGACSPDGETPSPLLCSIDQALTAVDARSVESASGADFEPAQDYTLFEADPVRPVVVLEESGLVAVANTVDDTLELLEPTVDGLAPCGWVKVGMRPVAVARVTETPSWAELWVINHISDSISVVQVEVDTCKAQVIRTIHVGDEPRDIVVAQTREHEPRVFVTTAHRGQHHPLPGARTGSDLARPPTDKQHGGLADVFVFDPASPQSTPAVVNLFTDTPRALALGPGVVYAAGFLTGNRTTAVSVDIVARRGLESLTPLLAVDNRGEFIEVGGELLLRDDVRGRATVEGGMPAVVGQGRCMPDPRRGANGLLAELCVATDSDHHIERVVLQRDGEVSDDCRCTSGDGALQPITSVIVKWFDEESACGEAFTRRPDGSEGCWLDREPSAPVTPAVWAELQPPPMAWNEQVQFTLADQDVFAIDVDDLSIQRVFSGVGTTLFAMAVHPETGSLIVANTDAQNLTRFEGHGREGSTSTIGHLHESRLTVIDPNSGSVQPVHLQTHVDYARCCARDGLENERSLAMPTAGAFSPGGHKFFFTALGSDKVASIDTRVLNLEFDNVKAREEGALRDLTLGAALENPAGPVGLAVDATRNRLYVKTLFTNEIVSIELEDLRSIGRVHLNDPESDSIRHGRHVLYNARLTSAHGDSACASCHVFGNFDGLAWDLGNPDAATVRNPGPFVQSTQLGALAVLDGPNGTPFSTAQQAEFRSNKGPMTTQTLRGLANHGALHWRGDRTRRYQDRPGEQPDYGSFDEHNSFGEFDVAITGLNGNDASLNPELFRRFTEFALQLTFPPNPIRALDDSLTLAQQGARANYFGCKSMTDEQFVARQCTALNDDIVDVDAEAHGCFCAQNPVVTALLELPSTIAFASWLQSRFRDAEFTTRFASAATSATGFSAEVQNVLAPVASQLALAVEQLVAADFTSRSGELLPAASATALSSWVGVTLQILDISEAYELSNGEGLLALLLEGADPGAPGTREVLVEAINTSSTVARFNLLALDDERARGTGQFADLLQGCSLDEPAECRLRLLDGLTTCHGCHTLDPRGNAEFEVFRPGFFGTEGLYSFDGFSQVFKVPHLRNAYDKVGMFGAGVTPPLVVPDSILGLGRGGLPADQPPFTGPQVRGFGFLHDGVVDTVSRLHSLDGFVASPLNPDGFEAVLPRTELRPACIRTFRAADIAALPPGASVSSGELDLCLASSPIPDVCFLDPADAACQAALGAVAAQLGDAGFMDTFSRRILPLCYQLGATVEGGREGGACHPQGLEERAHMESFTLAFDSNLKPMVGQQVTWWHGSPEPELLGQLLRAAANGHCDAAVFQSRRGYLVVRPNGTSPEASLLSDRHGCSLPLGQALEEGPITMTCYPPQPGQLEARRSAFAR